MSDASEGSQRLPNRPAVEAHRERRGRCRHGVLRVVGPEQLELVRSEQRLARGEDHPVGEGDLAIGVDAAAVSNATPASAEVQAAQHRLGRVEDRDIVVALIGEDAQLCSQVVVEVPVTIEVIGGRVQQHSALRRESLGVLELKARALADDRGLGVQLADQ